jgi:hypothetical protein
MRLIKKTGLQSNLYNWSLGCKKLLIAPLDSELSNVVSYGAAIQLSECARQVDRMDANFGRNH